MATRHYPATFDPRGPLPGDGERLLREIFAWRRYCSGLDCNWHIVSEAIVGNIIRELLDNCEIQSYEERECKYWMLMAHVNTQDPAGIRSHLNYWWNGSHRDQKKFENVSKFVPGDHYHCLNTKFNTLAGAKDHIEKNGFIFGEFIKRHVYKNEGD
jgi:hypothetical protein